MDLDRGEMYVKHVRMNSLDNSLIILYNENLVQEIKRSYEKMNG